MAVSFNEFNKWVDKHIHIDHYEDKNVLGKLSMPEKMLVDFIDQYNTKCAKNCGIILGHHTHNKNDGMIVITAEPYHEQKKPIDESAIFGIVFD